MTIKALSRQIGHFIVSSISINIINTCYLFIDLHFKNGPYAFFTMRSIIRDARSCEMCKNLLESKYSQTFFVHI